MSRCLHLLTSLHLGQGHGWISLCAASVSGVGRRSPVLVGSSVGGRRTPPGPHSASSSGWLPSWTCPGGYGGRGSPWSVGRGAAGPPRFGGALRWPGGRHPD